MTVVPVRSVVYSVGDARIRRAACARRRRPSPGSAASSIGSGRFADSPLHPPHGGAGIASASLRRRSTPTS